MTATTLSRLPLMAGSAVATTLGRAGLWTFSRYMRAPLASTGLLAMVTLTALASSNALYFQTARHPHPFFGPAMDTPQPVAAPAGAQEIAPIPQQQRVVQPQVVTNETTGSVAPIAAPRWFRMVRLAISMPSTCRRSCSSWACSRARWTAFTAR